MTTVDNLVPLAFNKKEMKRRKNISILIPDIWGGGGRRAWNPTIELEIEDKNKFISFLKIN